MKTLTSLIFCASTVVLAGCSPFGKNATPGSPSWMGASSVAEKAALWDDICQNYYRLEKGHAEYRRCLIEVDKTARMNRTRILGLNWPREDDIWGCPLPPVVLMKGITDCETPPRYGREIWPDAAAS
ncbi:MAG: hypothetical protein ACPGVK_06455 [Halocynthiibacter sp.]